MDWASVKSITLPQGNAKMLTINGAIVWAKPTPYQMLETVYFDGNGMFELPFNITGADTIRSKFETNATSGNLFGYFDSSSSDINFCLYGSSSSYIRYDGGLYRNWDLRSTTGVHDIAFSPTGLTDNGVSIATWSAKTFTAGHPTVGGLPNSTTVKNKWVCYYFKIDAKCDLRPAKRIADGAYGLLDVMSDTFYTGSFIKSSAT